MKNPNGKNFGVKDLRAMAPGEVKTFVLPTGARRAVFSTTAYREPLVHPREDVLRYKLHQHKVDENGEYPLTVTAIPV